jgi:tRNA (mo5U34)-methyltransferase
MLIGLERRFIFVSNLKTASTAIEAALRPVSQIAIIEPGNMKHLPLQLLLMRFKWLLDHFDLKQFLIFGVIRDPVDFLISLYNSHREDKFRSNKAIYTASSSFEEFLENWTKRQDWQTAEQHKRFLDDEGNIGANCIISYHNLAEGLQYVGMRLKAPKLMNMRRHNESPKYLSRDALTKAQIEQIKERFAADYRFMAQYCDRLLSPEDQRSWAFCGQTSGAKASSSPRGNLSALPHAVNVDASAETTGERGFGGKRNAPLTMTRDEVEQFVASHLWIHAIDLGDGIVTPGGKTRNILEPESAAIFAHLDLRGRSVMDVGAWNGYYTVESKRRGASKVLAVDSNLRGKETFDFVMKRLGLSVEALILDVQCIDEAQVGHWDVVLFLGVFYHLIDPIAAVMRLAAIANEVLVVETHLDAPIHDRPAMVFYPGRECANDPSVWWGPNRAAVDALLRFAGFKHVEFTAHPVHGPRGIFHAYKSDEAFQRHFIAGSAELKTRRPTRPSEALGDGEGERSRVNDNEMVDNETDR